jgi:hypothetical protein
MKYLISALSLTLLLGCNQSEPLTEATTPATTAPAPQTQYLGYVEYDREEAGVLTHHKYFIDSVKMGGIITQDMQGNDSIVMYFEQTSRRSLAFRYFDSNGVENIISLTEGTAAGGTNGISVSFLGSDPYTAQTNTSIPLCNTAYFEINILSPNEANFEADYLYNFYTDETVDITNGHYIMY